MTTTEWKRSMISNFRAPSAMASIGQHNRVLGVWIVKANTKMHCNVMSISLPALKINSESIYSINIVIRLNETKIKIVITFHNVDEHYQVFELFYLDWFHVMEVKMEHA